MSAESLETLCRYSFMPNKLGYCGPRGVDELLFKCAATGDRGLEKRVKKAFAAFPVLSSYLEVVRKKLGEKTVFSPRVGSAWWRGDPLVLFSEKDKALLAKHFVAKKLFLPETARRIASKIPSGAPVFHATHVLVFGSLTGTVKKVVENQAQCVISPAKVLNAGEGVLEALALVKPLKKGSGKYFLGNETGARVRTAHGKQTLVPGLRRGDWIAVHWGFAVEKITAQQAKRMLAATEKAVARVNAASAAE
ncbi:MAG: DUF6390 family protein [Candidatus Micrarchaeota archaeon]|nr:DUF6390 family protein [Candidatus Micrarchaeota archaeon]